MFSYRNLPTDCRISWSSQVDEITCYCKIHQRVIYQSACHKLDNKKDEKHPGWLEFLNKIDDNCRKILPIM